MVRVVAAMRVQQKRSVAGVVGTHGLRRHSVIRRPIDLMGWHHTTLAMQEPSIAHSSSRHLPHIVTWSLTINLDGWLPRLLRLRAKELILFIV